MQDTTKKVQNNDGIQRWKNLTTDLATKMAIKKKFYQKVRLYGIYRDRKFNPSPQLTVGNRNFVAKI